MKRAIIKGKTGCVRVSGFAPFLPSNRREFVFRVSLGGLSWLCQSKPRIDCYQPLRRECAHISRVSDPKSTQEQENNRVSPCPVPCVRAWVDLPLPCSHTRFSGQSNPRHLPFYICLLLIPPNPLLSKPRSRGAGVQVRERQRLH